jgi:hypothetical protein
VRPPGVLKKCSNRGRAGGKSAPVAAASVR